MTTRADQAEQLADQERRYRGLARQVADLGLVHSGSLMHRYTRCTNPNCGCRADPPRLHGPYWQWTTKVAGKTVTRRLTEREASLYQEWIANDRRLRRIIAQMRQLAGEATELILNAEQPQAPSTRRAGARVKPQAETPELHT
ncbi:MAG: DUF6788 family protein [Acidimicrobiales bacterium]